MLNLSQLTADSTLGYLPCYYFQVDSTTLVQLVAEKFAQKPALPGVIVMHSDRMLGMIARRQFYQYLNVSQALDFSLQQPIRAVLDCFKVPPLLLPEICPIDKAAYKALQRCQEMIYDPLVVVGRDRRLRLLDCQVLLVANSQITQFLKRSLQWHKNESNKRVESLTSNRNRLENYIEALEKKQTNQCQETYRLQEQKAILLRKTKEIYQLNQKFFALSQLAATDCQKAFRATNVGTNSITRHVDEIANLSKVISKELDQVHGTARQIGEIIQQVRHLTMQATISTKQSGNGCNELSQVNNELLRLVNQMFDRGYQMTQIGNRIKLSLEEMADSAKGAATVARSLNKKIEQAEISLSALEVFMNNADCDRDLILLEPIEDFNTLHSDIDLEITSHPEALPAAFQFNAVPQD